LFRALNVHVNVAKQMLYAFSNKNKDKVGLIYLLAGTKVRVDDTDKKKIMDFRLVKQG
jgi:DNA polymerase subunit Cdc27